MINSAEYSADGKFLVLPSLYIGGEEKKIPVALIDELLERGLSSYDLEKLLFVRGATANKITRKVAMEDLVGEDLTGKTVGVYFPNYEDSEWMETGEAIGVELDPQDGNYRFVFPEQYEKCWNGECAHNDDCDENSVGEECEMDSLQHTYFWAKATVLVTEKENN